MTGFANKSVSARVLKRARQGDMAAHAEIFRTFSRPVYTLAARMTGSTAVADDVLQESFLEIIRSIPQFRLNRCWCTPLIWIACRASRGPSRPC